jgi:N-acetylglutamate synthase/N-acetylornithine aminotransferase
MHYEVDVVVHHPLDERTRRFLAAVQHSANQVVRFRGDGSSVCVTVEVAGQFRDDAIRAAARQIAQIFPASNDEKYGEPHQVS